jgi:hypothetical protein
MCLSEIRLHLAMDIKQTRSMLILIYYNPVTTNVGLKKMYQSSKEQILASFKDLKVRNEDHSTADLSDYFQVSPRHSRTDTAPGMRHHRPVGSHARSIDQQRYDPTATHIYMSLLLTSAVLGRRK